MTEKRRNNRTALALGSFDGLHNGHMQVISAVVAKANEGLLPVLVRFDRHPAEILRGKAPARLLTDECRQDILSRMGVTEEILPFREICSYSPERFVQEILKEKLQAAFVSCGFNYRFGKNGEGTAQMLRQLCAENGIECSIAEEVTYKEAAVSATRIRSCLQNGQTEDANAMLGRPFCYDFEVVGGDRRGRLMGTPTINQYFPQDFLVPEHGVYAAYAQVNNELHPAVTNIGIRPTFNGSGERSETWIMDFSGDLYGQNIPVYLLSYLRKEVKFDNMDALRDQILSDAQRSRNIFESFQKKLKKNEKNA